MIKIYIAKESRRNYVSMLIYLRNSVFDFQVFGSTFDMHRVLKILQLNHRVAFS